MQELCLSCLLPQHFNRMFSNMYMADWMDDRTLGGGPWPWSDSSTVSRLRCSSPALKLTSLTAMKGSSHSTRHILFRGRKKWGTPWQPCLSLFNSKADTFPETSANMPSTIMVSIAIPRSKAGWEEEQLAWHRAAEIQVVSSLSIFKCTIQWH